MHLASGTICNNDRVWVGSLAHPTRKCNYRGTGILPVAGRYQMLTTDNGITAAAREFDILLDKS